MNHVLDGINSCGNVVMSEFCIGDKFCQECTVVHIGCTVVSIGCTVVYIGFTVVYICFTTNSLKK